MRKFLLASAVLFLICAGRVAAEDEVQAILEKAAKAHGGKDKLAKLKNAAVQAKSKGTIDMFGGIKVEIEALAQGGRFKQIIQTEVGGMNINQTLAYDGKEFWAEINGKVFTLKDLGLDEKKLKEAIEEQLYSERVVGLMFLGEKGIELSPLGEIKVNDKPAVGLRVSSKGHKDINLYFDKDKGLLVKTEMRATDVLGGQETAEEKILSDYKEMDGLPRPTKVAVLRDGKKLMDLEVTEVKILDKLEDSTFAKP
jgi:hypothetical protein